MTITITSTNQITTLAGVPVRVWKGVTERGIACHVFVHRLAVAEESDCSQFEAELSAQAAPEESGPRVVPLNKVI
jgi:hypothetical protein